LKNEVILELFPGGKVCFDSLHPLGLVIISSKEPENHKRTRGSP